ncbi:ATP-binding protein [Pseudomonas oryzihabitans]|uniref:Histidine kinase-, DNA gyrase B-, and HSP90-like ATPase n=1 Tax=Pseudomonas oryzihabitans TaxID=47885 RepID=A0A4Y5W2J1_9PSED|nr:ATP-binding protein [Pseudomonas psychrotolerans]QDD88622.1 hypothetical protein CCZ28_06205 [Pseudomonas psychrotolerans]
MPEASLKFGGKIIEELSQKIPSSLFALNELIKNAYDAFSPYIKIKIEPSQNTITISDNGNGMGIAEIENLFHISQSSKNYGEIIEQDGIQRITQGSKGLGFLAAFKFGHKVEWTTSKNGIESKFSLEKSALVSKTDLTGTAIPITTNPSKQKGTTIVIYSSQKYLEELQADLEDERVSEKLAAAIEDNAFNIEIYIENTLISSTQKIKDFRQERENDQLFYVKYNSEENILHFYHRGELLDPVSGLELPINPKDYQIDLELIIFSLGKGKKERSISKLNRRTHDKALYPLVYVNRNLFNNTAIFDPDILRKSKLSHSLPQIIGRVKITSQSKELEFNSDRTNFVENSLTKGLMKNLRKLNERIQTTGSELKKELQAQTPKNEIPTGKAAPISKPETSQKRTAHVLIDRSMPFEINIPSSQLDLANYIFLVKNSLGEEVNKHEVIILIDSEPSNDGILQSIEEPCEKIILFRYCDPHTKVASTEITLKFIKKTSSITGAPLNKSLFTIESETGYRISHNTISSLINGIDTAYQSRNKENYLPLIACSMRCILEISSKKTFQRKNRLFAKINTKTLNQRLQSELKSDLMLEVMYILILLKKNQNLLRVISEASGISFKIFNNLLDLEAFGSAVKLSNVGAHSSSGYLSKPKIEECANKCGLFAVICDILINLDSKTESSLAIIKLDETDFSSYLGQ